MRRYLVLGLGVLGSSVCIAPVMSGCGSSSCEDTDSCGEYTGGTGGGSGTGGAGTGGSSGTGGASTGGAGGASGTGGAGGSGGDAGSCDSTKSPSEEACLVSDAHAVFVSASAPAGGNGTRSSPFKTIAEALAQAAGKWVIVCNGTYDEHVTVGSAAKVHGGFSCSDWSYQPGTRALVKPSTQGAALKVDAVTQPVVVEDMEFASLDASAPGESSIAALVNASANVSLRRIKLVAGKGSPGANALLNPFTYPTQPSLNGKSASGATGGGLSTCACPGGAQSIGGKGGDGVPPSGQAGTNGGPSLGGGKGGTPGDCLLMGTGQSGNPGPAGADGPGASTLGTLNATWTPSEGAPGASGSPGQGGGGGASTATAGGGGGGCGGCGGAGGGGGGGGGASLALVVIDSTVSVGAGSELVTSDAGAGGKGAAGQKGQEDFGFGGVQSVGACQGGNGAPGGNGGAGGGGAGGLSVAVLWKGTAQPTLDPTVTVTLGNKGTKGLGGKPGSNDGIDGVADKMLQVN